MNTNILIKEYKSFPLNRREILRYAGCKGDAMDSAELMESCIKEAESGLKYLVCYRRMPLALENDICNLGLFNIHSADLAKALEGCSGVVIFAATVGFEIDRLITKYSRISPSRRSTAAASICGGL